MIASCTQANFIVLEGMEWGGVGVVEVVHAKRREKVGAVSLD